MTDCRVELLPLDEAKDAEGNIDYTAHAEPFLSAGLAKIGTDPDDLVELDPGDAAEIAALYPPYVVIRLLSHIVKVNTIGFTAPKG